MREITDNEIEFILNDLQKRGIQLEGLRDDLLDHICIIIENEMSESDEFETFYLSILPRFFKKDLQEIQTETNNLIRFKHFYAMKNTLNISGIATVLFTSLGAIFKTFHFPGAGILIVLAGFFLSCVFLPLLIVLKFRDNDSRTDKAVFGFGFLIAIILSAGLIFKLMHWPTANILMIGSTLVFTFIYVPLYFFTRFRRPEIRFNTIVNTVLMFACGGIFFSLFDLSYSYKYSKQIGESHRFIHDSSVRLFNSNERLSKIDNLTESGLNLRQQSSKVNEQLEQIASIIVREKSAKSTVSESMKLSNIISDYNQLLENIDNNELKNLDASGLAVLDRLNIEMALSTLARIQQDLAVNENCFLTSLITPTNNQSI